jgi:hypothetical protein
MGRPRKSLEEHLANGTAFPSRIKALNTSGNRFSIIKEKLDETEKIIKEMPVKGNAKELIIYSNLYHKLLSILEVSLPEEKKPDESTIIGKLIKRKAESKNNET